MNSLASWILFVVPLTHALPSLNTTASDLISDFLSTREEGFEWTAWGDSYASGVGAGKYIDGRRCLRYDRAYPQQMQNDPENFASIAGLTGIKGGGKFNNVVCSGAKAKEIVDYQFYSKDEYWGQPSWQFYPRKSAGKPKMGTMTVGGDNVDFPGILNNCILESFPWPLSKGFTQRTCDEQRKISWSLLSEKGDHKTPNKELKGSIELAISRALKFGKDAAGEDFQLYVTGYGQFFNDKTIECNDITFALAANPKDDGKKHVKLTQDLRKDFNAMSRMLNKAIQEVVELYSKKGRKIKFIDVDSLLEGHRFCEEGVKEPDQNNKNLWFYHYPYNQKQDDSNAVIKYLNKVADDNKHKIKWDPKSTPYTDFIDDFWSHVDENQLMAAAGAHNEADAQWYNLWPDSIGYQAKLFHPQEAFHAAITHAIITAHKTENDDTGTAGNAGPNVTKKPSYASTGTANGKSFAKDKCHLHLWEIKDCNQDGFNLNAKLQIWDAQAHEILGVTKPQPINANKNKPWKPQPFKSPLPHEMVITGELRGDYVQFTMGNTSFKSTDKLDKSKNQPGGQCGVGGWDPKHLGGECRQDTSATSTRQMDCYFDCPYNS